MENKKKFDIVQKVIDDTHYYWVDGEFYPSVTHILDVAAPKEYGLLSFFKNNTPEDIEYIKKTTADRGSLVHALVESLLNGEEVPLKDYPRDVQKSVFSFYEWFNEYKPTKNISEHMVASKKYRYAGT